MGIGVDLAGLAATAQANLVRRREVSALELVDTAIANIERLDAVASGRLGGPRPSLADSVTGTGPTDGAPGAGGCSSCLRSVCGT